MHKRPDDCRILVERATHADYLREMAEYAVIPTAEEIGQLALAVLKPRPTEVCRLVRSGRTHAARVSMRLLRKYGDPPDLQA